MNGRERSKAGGAALGALGIAALGIAALGIAALGCSPGGSTGGPAPAVGSAGSGGEAAAPFGPEPAAAGPAPIADSNPEGDVLFDPEEVPEGEASPAAPEPRRRGLIDRQVACEGGATTTVTGTVYIPSGELPLYNVAVYVPEAELAPLPAGASCSCEISGEPIVSALTDASGRFVLENVPTGPDIPLVLQVGDWRREINIGDVEPCQETAVPDGTLRLPANQAEGDIPKIAVATGSADALECLVRKLGVDESEFTNPRGGGRVNLFAGSFGADRYASELNEGEPFPPAEALWFDAESLQQYDVVLLSCEGEEDYVANKPPSALEGMFDYANLGGRVFASHYHGVWFQRGPGAFPDIATFTSGNDDAYSNIVGEVVTDFPKGQALAEWVVSAGVSETGAVPIDGGAHTIEQEDPRYAQRWLETIDPPSVQYLSANTPLGASDAEQCGRVVLSDLHVSPGPPDFDFSLLGTAFPEGCITSTLSPQEAVLAFMLFDLSACIVPDSEAPVAPPAIIR